MLLIVGVGVVTLALSNAQNQPSQAAVTPSPSPVVAGSLVTATPTAPPRGQGLSGPQPPPSDTPSATPVVEPSTTTTTENTPTQTVSPTPLSAAYQTLQKLDEMVVPARDPYALAARLKYKNGEPIDHGTDKQPGNYPVGHKDVFNVSDIENRNYYTITATVKKVTNHAYWYAQDGRAVDQAALDKMAAAFEQTIYPTDRQLFGSEWTPGVDNDPRITVLLAPLRGAGGSYSAADEYTRAVNPFSNEREMIYISTGGGWVGLESTLAHEFQHMIHWHEHPNQDIWLNEGSSVLASALNGYTVLGVDGDFMRDPDVQLNAWQASPGLARPNYGAAFLFLDYLRTHYGGDPVIRAVISAPEPGVKAIDTALASLGYSDRFVDAFKKWTLANLLDGQPGTGAGLSYPDREVQASAQVELDTYPTGHSGEVSQFGADYVQMAPPTDGTSTLHLDFSGQKETPLIPAPAHSGSAIWWSNRGDLADSTMTKSFDLRRLQSATLDFYLWYDIEQDFDYAYAEVSTDNGVTWDTLKGKYTSQTNPNGTNYGNAYTGKSEEKPSADGNGWLHERISLDPYAGKEVQVRFEYITDDGYNAQGLAVDDISIPELGFKDDAESDTGWEGAGFVRADNKLPQSYYLAVVKYHAGGVDIQPVEVDVSGQASFDVAGLGDKYSKAVLVIAGLTDHIIQHPKYELSVRPAK